MKGGLLINRTHVFSSNVSSIGWDNYILEVEFTDGSIYQYFNVPVNHYNNLLNTSSVGSYLHSYIRNEYTYKQIY